MGHISTVLAAPPRHPEGETPHYTLASAPLLCWGQGSHATPGCGCR